MSFQIKDKDGQAIPINVLDGQAAKLWGKEVHPKHYATPRIPDPTLTGFEKEMNEAQCATSGNWFDCIGHAIHSPGNYTSGWDNVRVDVWVTFIDGVILKGEKDQVMEHCMFTYDYITPYLDLIKHWESKGYTPVRVEY